MEQCTYEKSGDVHIYLKNMRWFWVYESFLVGTKNQNGAVYI